MSNWRIPPIGFCAYCLVEEDVERAALAIWHGVGLCRDHLGTAYGAAE